DLEGCGVVRHERGEFVIEGLRRGHREHVDAEPLDVARLVGTECGEILVFHRIALGQQAAHRPREIDDVLDATAFIRRRVYFNHFSCSSGWISNSRPSWPKNSHLAKRW